MNEIIRRDVDDVIASSPFIKEKLNGASILITGATGMLPSYMVYTLLRLCEKDDFCCTLYIGARNIQKARIRFGNALDAPYVHIFNADLTQPFSFDSKVDYIVHAASIASSDKFLTNPVEVLLPNTVALHSLLEVARREKASFLFFSSGAVYGTLPGKSVIREEDSGYMLPTDVRSCYGQSKRLGETMCAAYSAEYNVKASIIRPGHTYGPTMDLHDSRVFAEFVRNVIEGHDIEMKSDGTGVRAFCYISDATDAFFRAMILGEAGEAYNVSNPECLSSIIDLAEAIASLYPEKGLVVRRVERKQGDSYAEATGENKVALSIDKMRTLGWHPHVGIKDGFRRTIESFLK